MGETGRRSGPGQSNRLTSVATIHDAHSSRPSRSFTILGREMAVLGSSGGTWVIGATTTDSALRRCSTASKTAQGRSSRPLPDPMRSRPTKDTSSEEQGLPPASEAASAINCIFFGVPLVLGWNLRRSDRLELFFGQFPHGKRAASISAEPRPFLGGDEHDGGFPVALDLDRLLARLLLEGAEVLLDLGRADPHGAPSTAPSSRRP